MKHGWKSGPYNLISYENHVQSTGPDNIQIKQPIAQYSNNRNCLSPPLPHGSLALNIQQWSFNFLQQKTCYEKELLCLPRESIAVFKRNNKIRACISRLWNLLFKLLLIAV